LYNLGKTYSDLGLCLLRRKDRDEASRLLSALSDLDPRLAARYGALLRSRLEMFPAW